MFCPRHLNRSGNRVSAIALPIVLAFLVSSADRAEGRLLHVPSSIPTIEDAVTQALPYDTVLVSPGVYYPTRGIEFRIPSVTLMSASPRAAIVIFDYVYAMPAVFFMCRDSCAIEGFQILSTNAWELIEASHYGCTPWTIIGNRIENNYLWAGGSGLFGGIFDAADMGTRILRNDIEGCQDPLWSSCSGVVIEGNHLFDNYYEGITVNGPSSATIVNNVVERTLAVTDYGAPVLSGGINVLNTSGPVVVHGNRIVANRSDGYDPSYGGSRGGGMRILRSGQVTIEDNWIERNQAVYGGGIYVESSVVEILHNTIWANQDSVFSGGNPLRGNGGGLYAKRTSGVVEHNTFAYNFCLYDGAAVFADTSCSDLLMRGNIFANNRSEGSGMAARTAPPPLECNDVWRCGRFNFGPEWPDPTGTNGNISSDPIFCFPDTGNFALRDDSQCANPPSGCDLMGAHGVGCRVSAVRSDDFSGSANGIDIVPNPARGRFRISYISQNSLEKTTLGIYDASGRLVRVLAGPLVVGGRQTVFWDARRSDGSAAPSGMYFVVLRDPAGDRTSHLLLVR